MDDRSWKVLLVEDDEDDYILVRSMLMESTGGQAKLTWAQTYESGLKELAPLKPDIALVDFHLGTQNGLELVRAAVAQGCQVPFILLTGQGSYEVDVEAMHAGVVDYLEKSGINPLLLERAIRYAIEHKQAQDALQKAHDELELRVQERTRELAKANQELVAEISERKRAEQALRSSEAKFRTLAETTSTAIFILQDEKIHYANPAAKIITGYKPAELQKKYFWEISHPDYQKVLKERGVASQWIERFPSRYELKLVTKKGEERWVDVTAGGIDIDGEPAWVVTAFDITDRDKAEKDLKKANEELRLEIIERKRVEDALRESEALLEKALQEEQAMRRQLVQAEKHTALSRMMASVAHELNNPIQTVQNCLFLIKQDISPDSVTNEYLDMAVTEASRMSKLVCQLREAYRPSQPSPSEPVDLLKMLNEVHSLLAPHLHHQSVEWIEAEKQQSFTIHGNRDQIKQVFLNICMNAIEAMQPKGGEISISFQAPPDSGKVGIVFRDNGPGIAQEDLSKVFDPFFTTKESGTGLGLYICYDIVQRHGGQIVVDSLPGEGATFTVWLPIPC